MVGKETVCSWLGGQRRFKALRLKKQRITTGSRDEAEGETIQIAEIAADVPAYVEKIRI